VLQLSVFHVFFFVQFPYFSFVLFVQYKIINF